MKNAISRTTRIPHLALSLPRYFFASFLLLLSLLLYFIVFSLQKRQRPSRSDGGCCEKGMPSSGEKIVVPRAQSFGGGAACLNVMLPCPAGRPSVTV